jgi:hypothetical protein
MDFEKIWFSEKAPKGVSFLTPLGGGKIYFFDESLIFLFISLSYVILW